MDPEAGPSSSGQIANSEASTPMSDMESLFQGDNQLYPSNQHIANLEHHQRESDGSHLRMALPANHMAGQFSHLPGPSSRREPTLEDCYAALLIRPSEESSVEREASETPSSSTAPTTTSSSSSSAQPSSVASVAAIPSRPVNILPANKSLADLSSNNLIAIGRRSQCLSPLSIKLKKKMKPTTSYLPSPIAPPQSTPLGWQAEKRTIKERISHLYCNETLADVFFIVGNEENRETIPSHQFVLAIGSAVFDAMFNGGLTPKNTDGPLEIELPDIEPLSFLALLKFLYTDEVSIGPESVMTTLYTAKKYAVPAMETACVEFLKESLGADNAFMILTQAKLFDEPQLEKSCLELIDKNTLDALNGDGFTEIDFDTLCSILHRDSLRIAELSLFMAAIRWATAECERKRVPVNPENQRKMLGPGLELIRFPLMKIEEFAVNVGPSKILTDREMNAIFQYLAVSAANRTPIEQFCARPRCSFSCAEYSVSRFQRTEVRWGYCGYPDRIKFTVDRRIFVVGLGLYGSIVKASKYTASIKIIHCGTGKTMAENDVFFMSDGTSKPCRVSFMEPVEILPGVTYIASALVSGLDSFYGTKGLRRIVANNSDVTFQFTYSAANNNGTSVEDGQIPEIVFYTSLY